MGLLPPRASKKVKTLKYLTWPLFARIPILLQSTYQYPRLPLLLRWQPTRFRLGKNRKDQALTQACSEL
jgi:hypothetical protein